MGKGRALCAVVFLFVAVCIINLAAGDALDAPLVEATVLVVVGHVLSKYIHRINDITVTKISMGNGSYRGGGAYLEGGAIVNLRWIARSRMLRIRHAAIGGVVDGAFALQRNRHVKRVEIQTAIGSDDRIVGLEDIDSRFQRAGTVMVFVVYGDGSQYRVLSVHCDVEGCAIEMRRIDRWSAAVQSVVDGSSASIWIRYRDNLRSCTSNHSTVGVEAWSTQVETIGGRHHGTEQIRIVIPYSHGFQRRMGNVNRNRTIIGNDLRWIATSRIRRVRLAAIEGIIDGDIGSLIRNRNVC